MLRSALAPLASCATEAVRPASSSVHHHGRPIGRPQQSIHRGAGSGRATASRAEAASATGVGVHAGLAGASHTEVACWALPCAGSCRGGLASQHSKGACCTGSGGAGGGRAEAASRAEVGCCERPSAQRTEAPCSAGAHHSASCEGVGAEAGSWAGRAAQGPDALVACVCKEEGAIGPHCHCSSAAQPACRAIALCGGCRGGAKQSHSAAIGKAPQAIVGCVSHKDCATAVHSQAAERREGGQQAWPICEGHCQACASHCAHQACWSHCPQSKAQAVSHIDEARGGVHCHAP